MSSDEATAKGAPTCDPPPQPPANVASISEAVKAIMVITRTAHLRRTRTRLRVRLVLNPNYRQPGHAGLSCPYSNRYAAGAWRPARCSPGRHSLEGPQDAGSSSL